jgi:hydroxymethylpyrimidine/phosphomethylpyrimidine kinase
MVSQIETINAIAAGLLSYRPSGIVLDPVMVSKRGYHLLRPEAREALISRLLPLSAIVTPNIPEAEVLTGMEISSLEDMKKAAALIHEMGPRHVLIKGGHMKGDATDVLYDGINFSCLKNKRIDTKNTHGTGCTLSAAIAANLARGHSVCESVQKAKEYITVAIENSLLLGKGAGPTNHFYTLYKKAGMQDE